MYPTLLIENSGTREGINVESGDNGLAIVASGNISASGIITAASYNGSLSTMTGTIDGGSF